MDERERVEESGLQEEQRQRPEKDATPEDTGEPKDEEGGRTPPPDRLDEDPAYEPEEPLKGYKGG